MIGEAEAENDEEGRALEIAGVVDLDLEVVVMKSTDVAGENLLHFIHITSCLKTNPNCSVCFLCLFKLQSK